MKEKPKNVSPQQGHIIKALNASIRDLQEGIDRHCYLVSSIMEERLDDQNLKPLLEACPSKSRERFLKNAIKDAIDTLEASRKSFKSKQLEQLRKRLTQVLVDAV